MLAFDPTARKWKKIPNIGPAPTEGSEHGKFAVYDPQTDTIIQFRWHGGMGSIVDIEPIRQIQAVIAPHLPGHTSISLAGCWFLGLHQAGQLTTTQLEFSTVRSGNISGRMAIKMVVPKSGITMCHFTCLD